MPIFFQQATGEVSYDTQDADYGWGAFPYARLTHMCCCQGWDIGYWGGDPWQSDELKDYGSMVEWESWVDNGDQSL